MTQFDKTQSPSMFNRIAKTYDVVNRVLSFGIDKRWRKRLVKLVARKNHVVVLDLATGTGDVVTDLLRYARPRSVVGLDPSEGMLAIAKRKISDARATFEVGDAQAMRFDAGAFDIATMSFGIRNVPDVPKTLREIHRVLKPGGEALILEFSLPRNRFVRAGHLFYLRHILPTVGGLISGDRAAYAYLNKTIEQFPYGDAFERLLKDAGFSSVRQHRLTFGIATIYQAHV